MLDRYPVARGLLVCVALTTLSVPRVADACGCDCTTPTAVGVPVEVAGTAIAHRVVLSISPGRTVMWDQFMATGDQQSFAWLFPVRDAANVEVAVGSQAFVDALDGATSTLLQYAQCSAVAGGNASPDLAPIQAPAMQSPFLQGQQQSVEASPVEVATIDGSDPTNVLRWIADRGFEDPAIRRARQQQGDSGVTGGPFMTDAVRGYAELHMDFVAVRFSGGSSGTRMPPVRLSFTGYDPTLPLRGIAVGGAPNIGIEFIVLAPSGMQPQNYPVQLLPRILPVLGSDARTVFDATMNLMFAGDNWVIESIAPMRFEGLAAIIGADPVTDFDAGVPNSTGIDDAHAAFDPLGGSAVVTRMQARVSTAALGDDLVLAPAPTDDVQRVHYYGPNILSTFPDGGLRCPSGIIGPWTGDASVAEDEVLPASSRGCRCAVPGARSPRGLSRFAVVAIAVSVASSVRRRRASR